MFRKSMLFVVLLVFGFAFIPVGVAADGLVGAWSFDEGSGDVVADISGNGYDGTLVDGPTWTDGQYASALEFTASNDRVEIPPEVFDTIDQQCTMTFWAFGADALPVNTVVFQAMDGAGQRQWSAHLPWSNGQVYLDSGGTDYNRVNGAVDVSIYKGSWQHWAFVKNADTGELSVYNNGVVLLSEATGNTLPIAGVTAFTIGSEVSGVTSYLGILDDVQLYNVALTPEEIQQAMLGLGDKGKAGNPNPKDAGNDVLRDSILTWAPGAYEATHNVYVGATFEDVNSATVPTASGLDVNSFDPGRFEFGNTYFWRVDEVNASPDKTVRQGSVWSFTAEPYSIQIPGAEIIATASSYSNEMSMPIRAIDGNGLAADNTHAIQTEGMWFTEMDDPTPWIQFEFDGVKKLDTIKIWNSNSSAEGFIGYGVKGVIIETSTDGETWEALGEARELSRAPGSPDYSQYDEIALEGVAAKRVRLNIQSNWGGFLMSYSLSEVQFMMIPASARTPMPATEATGIVPDDVLSWRSGREAAQSTVYVGTDPNEVADGLAPSATSNTHSISLTAFDIAMGETYYWRVDEVNDAEAVSVWAGSVWSFSTVVAVVVDDFESYGNDSPDRPFQAWLDGYGYSADEFFLAEYAGNGTGAGVGHDIWSVASQYYNGDIMETANTMPSSSQSMPFYYGNSGGVASQTERTFAVPQDWTVGGAQTLSIAFAGQTGNTGTLYVKINNTKITYPRDPGNIAKGVTWQAWNIDLSSMDVQAVTTIQIGIDGSGASGMILIDDIKLHPEAGVVITPAAPSDDNLVGAWSFDEGSGTTAADSSGNGHNGTIVGGTFEAGQVGSALVFDGLTSMVTLPAAAWDTIENQVTACFWAYVDSSITQDPVTFAAYQDLTVNDSRVISAHLVWNDGTLYFDAGGSVAETYDRISKGASAAVYGDVWIHWAFVKNVDTGMMKVYRNGILWLSGSDLVRPMTGVTAFTLGATAKDQVDFWKGSMDEFKLYNTELTQEEILSLAGVTAPVDQPF